MNKKITVIIPIYNAEKTLISCIDSVLKQNITDIEIILVNDGSTDNTINILENYRSDSRITIINQENNGVSNARNKGISIANGEYLFFIDSDDIIESGTLLNMYNFAKCNNLDLVSCRHREPNTTQYGGNENKASSFVAKNDKQISKHFLDIFPKSACAKLFKHELIKKNGLKFPINMSLGEDMYFVYQYLHFVHSTGLVDNVYYNIQNINEFSLSKKYVENIEYTLIEQNKMWKSLTKRFPEITSYYYQNNMDFELYLVSIFVNNLFKRDSPYKFREKLSIISHKCQQYSSLLEKKVNNEALPKNNNEKIIFYILKSKNSFFIGLFYYIKELIKKHKIKRGNLNV